MAGGGDVGAALGDLLGKSTHGGGQDGGRADGVLRALLSAAGHAQTGGATPLNGLLGLLAGTGPVPPLAVRQGSPAVSAGGRGAPVCARPD